MKEKWKYCLGIVLLVVLLCCRFFLELITRNTVGLIILQTVYWGAVAYALYMLDVVAPAQHAAENMVAVAAIGVHCILFLLSDALYSYGEANVFLPGAFGCLVIMLALISCIGSRNKKEPGRFSLIRTIMLFALLAYGCVDYASKKVLIEYLHPRPDHHIYTVVMLLQYIRFLAILPFLKKNRKSGLSLVILSAIGLSAYLALEYSPLSALSKGADFNASVLIYRTLQPNANVWIAILFGGLWCWLSEAIPSFKNSARTPR